MPQCICVVCSTPFDSRFRDTKYCGEHCRRKAEYQRTKAKGILDGICPRCKKRPSDSGFRLCTPCRAHFRHHWANRSPEAKEKLAAAGRSYRERHPEKGLAANRRSNRKIKLEVLAHYSASCVCCGESDYRFLTIDHINGNGNIHRREIFGSQTGGARFYRWLKRSGFPDGFQTLCYNCNMGRAKFGGICPHKLDESDA